MSDIQLTKEEQVTFNIVNGDIVLLEGANDIQQQIFTVLSTQQGSYDPDPSLGLPWLTEIAGKNGILVEAAIIEAVEEIEGVSRVSFINTDLVGQTRELNIQLLVELTNGDEIEVTA